MNFKYKCLLQHFFSNIPNGQKANYLFQKHVSKSFPPSKQQFIDKVNMGFRHFKNFENYNQLTNSNNSYYEFGAGWNLAIPLTISFLGFEVSCIDIKRLVVPELIIDSLKKFTEYQDSFSSEIKVPDCQFHKHNVLQRLSSQHKLNYIAPMDAKATNFADNYFSFISSSLTLEHIPQQDILPILKECYRVLSKGGVLSMTIDYQDHWSYFDNNISIYNFLRYSTHQWKRYNPSLHYQNRLRHADYLDIIKKSGFNIIKESIGKPSDKELEILKNLPLSSDFKRYTLDELSIKDSEIVLIK